jgi:hypothetical protein
MQFLGLDIPLAYGSRFGFEQSLNNYFIYLIVITCDFIWQSLRIAGRPFWKKRKLSGSQPRRWRMGMGDCKYYRL